MIKMEEKLRALTFIMMAIGVLYVFDGLAQGGSGITGFAISERQQSQDVACFDSDSHDYYTAGTTYARFFKVNGEGPKSDVCEGDTLIEYFCALNEPQVEFFDCPNGCISGTCVQ